MGNNIKYMSRAGMTCALFQIKEKKKARQFIVLHSNYNNSELRSPGCGFKEFEIVAKIKGAVPHESNMGPLLFCRNGTGQGEDFGFWCPKKRRIHWNLAAKMKKFQEKPKVSNSERLQ